MTMYSYYKKSGQNGGFRLCLRIQHRTTHSLNICHGAAHTIVGKFQDKVVIRFQQNALSLHETLAHSAVCCLTEVAAFGVLHMGAACKEGDLHIGKSGTRENAGVLPLSKVGEDQPLPVEIQFVGGAGGCDLQATAPGEGF